MKVPAVQLNVETKRLRFWHEFLGDILIDVRNKFQAGPRAFRKAGSHIYDEIINSLVVDLEPLVIPTIVSYLHYHKGEQYNNTSIYDNLFSGDFIKTRKLLEEFHSPTFYQIYNKCRRFRLHIETTCERIFRDWRIIQAEFSISNSSELYSLELTCGDEHGQGGQTSIFCFDKGVKGFIYKPVDISIDLLMHDMFAYYDNNFKENFEPTLKIYSKGQDSVGRYGYIEFCPYNGRVRSKAIVKKTYYNVGKLLAFGKFFKIADGHSDNVIINAPKAIWLDLETAFHTFSSEIKGVHALEKTGLIMEAREENTTLGIVTAIQGGVIPRLNLTSPSLHNDGQDDMYIRYFQLKEVGEKKNRIFLKGKLCSPETYAREIKNGYKETFVNLLKNREQVINFLKVRIFNQELKTRHLFLATACYARYIGIINHVIANQKGNTLAYVRSERQKVIMSDEAEFQSFIIENEFMDICNGVIPYFYRCSNSTNIYHASGTFRKGFFQESTIDNMIKHMLELSIDDLPKDLHFIDKALFSTANISTWQDFKTKFNFPMFDYEEQAKRGA